jgi:hypothetical protein
MFTARRLLALALVAPGLSGCAAFFAGRPEAPEVLTERLRREQVPLAAIRQGSAVGPSLRIREVALAEVPLGAQAEAVRARFGSPRRTHSDADGLWWEFEEFAPLPVERRQAAPDAPPEAQLEPDAWRNLSHIRVLLNQRADGEGAARVVHVQAWAPARFMTRSMIRPLDPAARVVRKYGPPPRTRAWGAGEVWTYPEADVAFVVTPDHPEQPRVVAGILVGLTSPSQPIR